MKDLKTKKLVLTALLAGIAVVGSTFSFQIMGSKCSPVQHLVNIVTAILLGPTWAIAQAFIASTIRNLMGLGTVLAFPGSLFGAALAGLLYQRFHKTYWAAIGEVFGTAVLGGLASYPIALYVMGNSKVVLFTFVLPFFVSTFGGAVIAMVFVTSIQKLGILKKLKGE